MPLVGTRAKSCLCANTCLRSSLPGEMSKVQVGGDHSTEPKDPRAGRHGNACSSGVSLPRAHCTLFEQAAHCAALEHAGSYRIPLEHAGDHCTVPKHAGAHCTAPKLARSYCICPERVAAHCTPPEHGRFYCVPLRMQEPTAYPLYIQESTATP